MIDAGADLFVGHGPHVLRGIEIYKGAPILYSLGDFIFQNETLLRIRPTTTTISASAPPRTPNDYLNRALQLRQVGLPGRPAIWESVVAMPRFRDGARRTGAAPDLARLRRRPARARPAAIRGWGARSENPR